MNQSITDEVAHWPGCTVTFEMGSKHPRAVLWFREQSRFVVFSGTSVCRRGVRNNIGNIRAELRSLGASRAHAPPCAESRPKRPRPFRPIHSEPALVIPDPWAALRDIRQ